MKIRGRKFFTALLIAAMLLSMFSMTALAAIGEENGHSKSKTATPLEGGLATVTLSLPSGRRASLRRISGTVL